MFNDEERHFLIETVQQRTRWFRNTIEEMKQSGDDFSQHEKGYRLGKAVLAKLKTEHTTPTQAHGKGKLNLLVIDDVGSMRSLLKEMLLNLGYENVDTAENAKKGLAALLRKTYNMVFCDWDMPDMTGLDMVKEVRAGEKNQDVAFVMVTGMNTEKHLREAIAAGVTDYIIKPINANILQEKIHSNLG